MPDRLVGEEVCPVTLPSTLYFFRVWASVQWGVCPGRARRVQGWPRVEICGCRDYICSNREARSEQRSRGWDVRVGEVHSQVHQASGCLREAWRPRHRWTQPPHSAPSELIPCTSGTGRMRHLGPVLSLGRLLRGESARPLPAPPQGAGQVAAPRLGSAEAAASRARGGGRGGPGITWAEAGPGALGELSLE